MATLTLIKDDLRSDIAMLCFQYLKYNNDIENPTIHYGQNFFFEYADKKYTGFFASLYALINFFNCFDELFNKDENKVNDNEEFLFHLENNNFQLSASQIKNLNDLLSKKSFIISEKQLSIVDIFYFYIFYKWMEKANIKEKLENLNLCRWFIYVQDVLLKTSDILKKLELKETLQKSLDAKFVEKEAICKNKKKEEKENEKKENEKKENEGKENEGKEKEGKIKGGKKDKKKKPAEKKVEVENEKKETRPLDDITRLNMLVGYVEHVSIHPDADTLYCLKINVGEEKVRDICSGLRNKKNPEDLLHQHVIVLANLKEKALRGKKSHGMILCGSHNDKVEILVPPPGVKIGERITCENEDASLLPDKVLSFDKAKNPFYHIQPHLILKNGVAYYKEAKLVSSQGDITCVLQEGTIS